MGSGPTYLKDGQDFHQHPDSFRKDFGFTGSSEEPHSGEPRHPAARGKSTAKAGAEPQSKVVTDEHGEGSSKSHFAHGGFNRHPAGHEPIGTDSKPNGEIIIQHAHGGTTHLHPDGNVTHHDEDGMEMHAEGGAVGYAHGASVRTHPHGHEVTHVEPHGDGEIHRHAHGGFTVLHGDGRISHHDADGGEIGHGDMAQDKAMVSKGIHQHEDQEHEGKHSKLELARGGGARVRIPRAMMPRAAKTRTPIAAGTPTRGPSMRNPTAGAQAPMGVEPSAEPDIAGADQVPQLRGGGRMRR